MQRTDLSSGLGPNVQYLKYTLTWQDLASATTTGANVINLPVNPGGNPFNSTNFAIPQGGTVLFSRLNVTTAFTGGSVSALTLSVGAASTANAITTSTDILTAAVCVDTHGMHAELNSNLAATVTLTFTSTTHAPSVLTAGQLDLYLLYLDVSTPSA